MLLFLRHKTALVCPVWGTRPADYVTVLLQTNTRSKRRQRTASVAREMLANSHPDRWSRSRRCVAFSQVAAVHSLHRATLPKRYAAQCQCYGALRRPSIHSMRLQRAHQRYPISISHDIQFITNIFYIRLIQLLCAQHNVDIDELNLITILFMMLVQSTIQFWYVRVICFIITQLII